MKNLWKNRVLLLLAVTMPLLAQAQSDDDLYFDPVWDVQPEPVAVYESTPPTTTYREELPEYDDEYDDYEYWEDQGYFYSSRLRRFHNPYRGFDYYDPVYTDLGFYDPWIMPGSSIYINIGGGGDYWSWRRYNRMRWGGPGFAMGGWNTWGWRYYSDPWSYNRWGAFRVYDPWFDPYWGGACFNRGWNYGWNGGWGMGWNNGWGNGWNNGWNNGWGNDFYNQPGYWYGNGNGTISQNPKGTHYGPRIADSRTGPSRGTVRDPEYVGGGIPVLKQGNGRPSGPGASEQGDADGGRVIRDNPQTNGRDVSSVREGLDQPTAPRNPQVQEPVGRDPLRPAAGQAERSNTDQVKEGRTWSDIPDRGSNQTVERPVREERSRDSYRDDYLKNRQNPPSSDPRTFPQDSRTRTRPERSPQTRPNTREDRPTRSREQTTPSRTERRNDRPTYQAPRPPRQETPSRTFDRPSRSNNSGGGGSFNSGGNSNRQSGSRSGGGSPRKSGRGGDQ